MNLGGLKLKWIAKLFDKVLARFGTAPPMSHNKKKNIKRASLLLPLTLLMGLFQNCAPGGMKTLSSATAQKSKNASGATTVTTTTIPGTTTTIPAIISGAPLVLYTDIVSGPNTGGELNQGAYLSIFGKNFGSNLANVKVFLENVEVARYLYLGPSMGRSDIQQISVQIGSAISGVSRHIRVSVSGVDSNTDKLFSVNPGRMIFVDPVSGNDATAVVGDVTKPFKHVQTTDLTQAAWGQVRAGDFIVMRAGTHTGVGRENYFLRFITATSTILDTSYYGRNTYINGSGVSPNPMAAISGPITLMGYPGESPLINCTPNINSMGCLSGMNRNNYPNAGRWIVIANLKIEGGGYDGPISEQIGGENWRIVNNEITAYSGVTWQQVIAYNRAHGLPDGSSAGISPSRMGGITGSGMGSYWVGNNIHDIYGSDCAAHTIDNQAVSATNPLIAANTSICGGSEAHGIYIDGEGSYEVAYNHIHDIKSGKGFQSYNSGSNSLGSPAITEVSDVNLHHNLIHNTLTFGINIADSARAGWVISNNVVYAAGAAALQFNTMDLVGCKIFNNTIIGTSFSDWRYMATAVQLKNNIIDPSAFGPGGGTMDGTFENNLWLNVTSLGFGTANLFGDPKFVSTTPGAEDFHLKSISPAIDRGISTAGSILNNDYDASTARPRGAGFDIGAFEF
jgi:hypothetical protein